MKTGPEYALNYKNPLLIMLLLVSRLLSSSGFLSSSSRSTSTALIRSASSTFKGGDMESWASNGDILVSESYELIDCGDNKRLERFGELYVIRSCPTAVWRSRKPQSEWKADLIYQGSSGKAGEWRGAEKAPQNWTIRFHPNVAFLLSPSDLGQVGVFPEQQMNWRWIYHVLERSIDHDKSITDMVAESGPPQLQTPSTSSGNSKTGDDGRTLEIRQQQKDTPQPPTPLQSAQTVSRKVLNGFGYTGGSTMAALSVDGVQVTHLDASKSAVSWATRNAAAAGLANRPVRWITDDCMTFLEREVRRGNKYHGLIFDPPAFGRGGNGKIWKLEKDLPVLVDMIPELLADDADFVLLSCHDVDWPPERLAECLGNVMARRGGRNIGRKTTNVNTKSAAAAGIAAKRSSNSRGSEQVAAVAPSSSIGATGLRVGAGWLEHGPMVLNPRIEKTGNALPLGGYARWSSDKTQL